MKLKINYVFIGILLILFIAGFFILLNGDIGLKLGESQESQYEYFDASGGSGAPGSSCPDLLIKDGGKILLYNNNQPKKEGVNPKQFANLDEYSNYLEEQYKNGVNCPVLFLQKENDAQNKDVYRIRPSPFYVEGGLPALPVEIHDNTVPIKNVDASRENGYNKNMYPGFDPHNLDNGRFTELDVIHESTSKNPAGSLNPADPNWLGVITTQRAVDNGEFKENEVNKVIYPKVTPLFPA